MNERERLTLDNDLRVQRWRAQVQYHATQAATRIARDICLTIVACTAIAFLYAALGH